MRFLFHSVLLFFLLFEIPVLSAQTRQYQFKRLSSSQGSPAQINSILEDSQGFMWFGTINGLNRFNGYNFRAFRHDIRDTTSLTDNIITHVLEDPAGLIWVRTLAGLNIFDPKTESFYRNPASFLKKYGLPDQYVTKILPDGKGNFWFLNTRQGLSRYNPQTRRVWRISGSAHNALLPDTSRVADMVFNGRGELWLIHYNGVLEKLNAQTGKVAYRNADLKQESRAVRPNYALFVDRDGDAWVYPKGSDQGLYWFNDQTKTFLHIHRNALQARLNNNIVRSVTQDNQGLIWIGTDHGGINVLNKVNLQVSYLLHHPENDRSISQNSIYNLYKDRNGILWVGTYKLGINYYHESLNRFPLYKHLSNQPNSLTSNDINRFVEDARGNLWIGTNGSGLIYFDRAAGRFTQYKHDPADPQSLSNNVIVGLYLDRQQKLWIGTYFGGLNSYDGKFFKHYKHDPSNPASLTDDRVWEIFEDSHANLWVGTSGGGLDLLNRQSGQFKHHRQGQPNSIHSDYISSIAEDREGNLWVGTAYGLDKRNHKTGRFRHYVNNNNDPRGLSNNNVNTVIQDSRGLIWIATNEGLNYFDIKKGTFQAFRREDGLPDNSIVAMVEDKDHHLWLTTPNGLSKLTITRQQQTGRLVFRFRNFDESDGLQGKAFNYNASFKTSKGELAFGGANGFNLFDPASIPVNTQVPKIIFTDFQVFNSAVQVGERVQGRVLLPRALNHTREITLQYQENMFSVSFAALSYFQPEKNQYAYTLEGFHDSWLASDSRVRKATFTNLDPGTYVFKVRASNNDGVWNREGISLKITILPPWWKTNWAFAAYLVLILLALWLGRRMIQERERLKYRIAQQRQEADRRHELDMMKIRFFTNVSHEFRTPLTLILAPLEKMWKQAAETDQKNQLLLIYRNARRLLNLVNQLLDFRKLEVQGISLHATKTDVIPFIREIAFSFSDLSEKKHISFSFHTETDRLEMHYDQDKLEKILFNLLSNAFKFTHDGGQVRVEVGVQQARSETGQPDWLRIQVMDSGIGIPVENHDKIFKRFFQNDIPGSMVNQGSGIGLSITREFVKLHKGRITVTSAPEQGSCFTVLLPLNQDEYGVPVKKDSLPEQVLSPEPDMPPAGPEPSKKVPVKVSRKPVLLLIEDNEDFRFYLKDNLHHLYQIHEAPNGKLGWQLVLQQLPDLVVSDIMMPEMDGIALCKKIRSDARTSHIPVILLTANVSEEQQLTGFETGANDYITKPFNFEILQSRIKNLVAQQEVHKKALVQKMEVKPQPIHITSLDEKLIRKALETVEKQLANPDFSVEVLSREMGMSRVYLYKKLLSLTGKSPIEFIRTLRLKRAAQLLEESQLTVSEIAYEVGFNNPKYFSRYFKTEFHCLPSAYAARNKESQIAADEGISQIMM